MGKWRQDLTGQVFGKLTVLGFASGGGDTRYRCQCQCGQMVEVSKSNLVKSTRSCGCSRIKHGMTNTNVYKIWKEMLQRCHNVNNSQYHDYGGRGITVDPKWHTFTGFFEDMGEPSEKATLERIDNDKGYSKGNCKWASWKDQQRNRRNNHLVTAFGKTQCVAAWAEEAGLKERTLHNRLFRSKMKPEDALTWKTNYR